MDEPSTSSAQTEREQLQEDIVRIQLALQSDEDDFGSDYYSEDENTGDAASASGRLRIDTDEDTLQDGDGDGSFKQTEDSEEQGKVQLLGDQVLPVNYETCLALNLAYQEILTDTLKKVEQALAENREKQNEVRSELENKSIKKVKSFRNVPLAQYATPYFKTPSGSRPLPNPDVVSKRIYKELTQNVNTDVGWKVHQRKQLIAAVKNCRIEELLRPLMNRKEIMYEKLAKDLTKDERKEIKEKIKKIGTEIQEKKNLSDAELLHDVNVKTIDWMKISVRTFDGKKDAFSCQMMWQNVLDPNINCRHWSEEEEERLAELVEEYSNKNWMAICKDLGTNRTPYQCLQHYNMRMNNIFMRKEWTETEDKMLCEVVESCRMGNRIPWNQVSYYMEGRSGDHCCSRWNQVDPAVTKGKWSMKEDSLLIAAMAIVGSKQFHRVAEFVPGRNAVQCRERWMNSLDPNIKLGGWTYEEDKFILESVQKYGRGAWSTIAAEMKNRNDNQVLQRFKKLMDWKKKSDWLEQQPEEVKNSLQGDVKSLLDNLRGSSNPEDLKRLDEMCDTKGTAVSDYLKQEHAKLTGDLVVPRKPLLLKGSGRNADARWKQRQHLTELIKKHISAALETGLNVSAKDVNIVVDKSLTDFLKAKGSSFLKKGVSNMSVKEMLEVSKNYTIGQSSIKEVCQETESKKVRKKKVKEKPQDDVNYLDVALRTIIACKDTKLVRGRPRKIPWDPDTLCDTPEEQKKISQATATLLMKSMDVDYKTCQRKIQSRKVNSSENMESIEASVSRDTPTSDLEPEDSEDVTIEDVMKTSSAHQESASKQGQPSSLPYQPPNLTTMKAFKILLLQRRKLTKKCDNAKKSKRIKPEPKLSHSDTVATCANSQAVTSSVDSIINSVAANTPYEVYQNVSSSSFTNIADDTHTTVNPPCAAYSGEVTGDNEITLQEHVVSQGDVTDQNSSVITNQTNESTVSDGFYSTTQNKNSFAPKTTDDVHSSYTSKVKSEVNFSPHVINQLVTSAKQDNEYQMLKARFQALFLWPALLSTIYPPEVEDPRENVPTTKCSSKKPQKQTLSGKVLCVEFDASNEKKEEGAEKKEKKKPKQRYAMINGKRYYKNQILRRELKEEKHKKRKDIREAKVAGTPYTSSVSELQPTEQVNTEETPPATESETTAKKRCGRPKGSKNFVKKPKEKVETPIRTSNRIAKIKDEQQVDQNVIQEVKNAAEKIRKPRKRKLKVLCAENENDEAQEVDTFGSPKPKASKCTPFELDVKRKMRLMSKQNKQSVRELTEGFLEITEKQRTDEYNIPEGGDYVIMIAEPMNDVSFDTENNVLDLSVQQTVNEDPSL